ncbi:hypothetical protein A2U01_0004645 [Trifolium medium]|uniref:Uncharacterized protein n=1 Tax=Trifolium medium TaxID=97028 RepID=A0A392M9E0_9FABA|nr:hypothetical protein [Trifolium medium]
MEQFCIPWPCLDSDAKQPDPVVNQPKSQKSFAQAVNNVCDIPLSQLPQPCVKGDGLAISIPEVDYLAGIDACKHNLHGRIIWPKGSTPLTVVALKDKLAPLWKDLARWGVTSLGKGYYEFVFSSLEDVRRVRSIASWSLNPGTLKLFAWTKDFNPKIQQNFSAQVWVRMYGLAQEYWRPNILFAIASSVGTPICIDATTAKPIFDRTFGQFVRVLVDMDLTQTLSYKVLVERIGFAFFVELDYDNLPAFCSNCRIIGHHVEVCKKINSKDETATVTDPKETINQHKEVRKRYVQKNDSRMVQRNARIAKNVDEKGVEVADAIEEVEIIENQPEAVAQKQIHKSPSTKNNDVGSKSQPVVSHNSFEALIDQEESVDQSLKQQEDIQEKEDVSQSTDAVEETQKANTDKPDADAVMSNKSDRQSWANMVEQEDELDTTPIKDKPLQPPISLITDRIKKKKPLNSNSPKKPFDSKQKGGSSKPFK